jgi:RNA polymerase sigma factor (sigma-70 family)
MYQQFSDGLLERKEFEGQVFSKILENINYYNCYGWIEEEYKDFVSWLYPRLKKTIDSYRETGSSFENYISSTIRMTAREYHCRRTERLNAEYAAWTVRLIDMFACENEPEYSEVEYPSEEEEPEKIFNFQKRQCTRQLLILILKCYHFISDDMAERLAPRINMGKNTLKKILGHIRAIRLKRDEYLRLLKERTHCQFFRCLSYERRLMFIPEESGLFLKIKHRLERARERLESMRKRLALAKYDPTNQQIADIIGVSKSTVDVTLYKLKNRWKENEKNGILN